MLEALQQRMVQTRKEIETLSASMAEGEESMAVVAARRRETQEKVNQGRESILAVAVEKTNAENRLRSLGEGQSATGRRMERLATELTQSQNVQMTLQSEQQSLQAQRSSLEGELGELRTHQEQLEVSLQSQNLLIVSLCIF